MRLEHVAFNVHDPVEVSAWYCDHLGMTIVRRQDTLLRPHFLADSSGVSLLEFYHNANMPVPDYATTDPFTHHIAFVVDDIEAEAGRLVAGGATLAGSFLTNPDGDIAVFLRDPWGLALQLVQRTVAIL
jgi:catechol 2,3-dioxygenase-like lactoylglutathione lyase family enzyme